LSVNFKVFPGCCVAIVAMVHTGGKTGRPRSVGKSEAFGLNFGLAEPHFDPRPRLNAPPVWTPKLLLPSPGVPALMHAARHTLQMPLPTIPAVLPSPPQRSPDPCWQEEPLWEGNELASDAEARMYLWKLLGSPSKPIPILPRSEVARLVQELEASRHPSTSHPPPPWQTTVVPTMPCSTPPNLSAAGMDLPGSCEPWRQAWPEPPTLACLIPPHLSVAGMDWPGSCESWRQAWPEQLPPPASARSGASQSVSRPPPAFIVGLGIPGLVIPRLPISHLDDCRHRQWGHPRHHLPNFEPRSFSGWVAASAHSVCGSAAPSSVGRCKSSPSRLSLQQGERVFRPSADALSSTRVSTSRSSSSQRNLLVDDSLLPRSFCPKLSAEQFRQICHLLDPANRLPVLYEIQSGFEERQLGEHAAALEYGRALTFLQDLMRKYALPCVAYEFADCIFRTNDSDGDGMLTFSEFCSMFFFVLKKSKMVSANGVAGVFPDGREFLESTRESLRGHSHVWDEVLHPLP